MTDKDVQVWQTADSTHVGDLIAGFGKVREIEPCHTDRNCIHLFGTSNWCIARGQIIGRM